MNKLIYLFGILVFLQSCQDVVEVDVPNGKPRLVIDANFGVYKNETPQTTEGGIRLTLSAPFFDEDVPSVSDAIVFITNLTDNSVINFIENPNTPGLFIPETGSFDPEFDIDYELTVIYDNETYTAATQLFRSVPINSVVQGDGVLFDEEDTEIIVSITDDPNRENYYLFDFDFNLYIASEDRFYPGEEFVFSYFYEDMVAGEEITINVLGIDKQYFNYSTILIEQSEQDGGDPFQSPPVQIRGNIINTTNQQNYALGYFNLSEANRFSITISEE